MVVGSTGGDGGSIPGDDGGGGACTYGAGSTEADSVTASGTEDRQPKGVDAVD